MNEIWKTIKGFEDYHISNMGRVKSFKNLKPFIRVNNITTYGYYSLILANKKGIKCRPIHRLVALAFIPNPENKPEVNHKNGIKTDNRIDNLEWCTRCENIKHAFDNGAYCTKANKSRARKLNLKQVRVIRYALHFGADMRELAKSFGVSSNHICKIKLNKAWNYPPAIPKL